MENIDWKEVAKESAAEVLNELKTEGLQIVKEQVIPGIVAAKDEFISELKTEAAASGSLWVKIRSVGVIMLIGIVGKIINNVVDKICTEEKRLEGV